MRKSTRLGLLAALALLLTGASALAQTSGSVTLMPGFVPDPQRLSGISGGPIQASTLNPSCRGWIAPQANHAMNIQGGFMFLRTFVESTTDTTLVIRAPNGQFFCNDDTYGFNPAIDAAYGPGSYLVWVGSYSQGNSGAYNITFSQLRTTAPGSAMNPNPMPMPNPNPMPMPPMPTSAPHIVTASSGFGGPIFDFHTTTAVAVVRQACTVMNATVIVRGRHTFNSDMVVRLRGPSGETDTLQSHSSTTPFRTYQTRQFNGSSGAGAWLLSIEDSVRADSGTLIGFTLALTCR